MVKQRLRDFAPMLRRRHHVDCNEDHAGQDPGYPRHVGVDDEHTWRTRTTQSLRTLEPTRDQTCMACAV